MVFSGTAGAGSGAEGETGFGGAGMVVWFRWVLGGLRRLDPLFFVLLVWGLYAMGRNRGTQWVALMLISSLMLLWNLGFALGLLMGESN